MGMNAVVQMLIPPPKYTVDRLLPCRMTCATHVRELFIIEPGAPALTGVSHNSALSQLLVNTDDAYGFPPFRYLAPAVRIAGQDYHQLRQAEREMLASFLTHVRVRALASSTFSWADDIPRLIEPACWPMNGTPAGRAPQVHAGPDAWPRWNGGRVYGGAA
jgi:hypothetical protein